MTETQQLDRALAQLETSARFLESRYIEGVIEQAVSRAVVASQSPWLDRTAAAARWRCSVQEIDRAARDGVLTRYERGATPLFNKDQGDEAIRSGKWKLKA